MRTFRLCFMLSTMKAYAIFPTFGLTKDDPRSRACIDLVSAIVVEALRRDGDHFHFAVDWLDPGAAPDSGVFHEDVAEPHIKPLGDAHALIARVRRSIDPFNGSGSTVRSIATCRAATFGYDGQAFICLRHEDEPPVTPDSSLVGIEERSDLLIHTDYFDGRVRSASVTGNPS